MERIKCRRTIGQCESIEHRDDESAVVRGLVAPYYDGTPGTQYELFPGVYERYMPGAFRKALEPGADVHCFWNHNTDFPLGRTLNGSLTLFETSRGLEYECTLGNTSIAKDVAEYLRTGVVSGSSAGFFIDQAEWREDGGIDVRELQALEVFDVSPTPLPAYEYTPTGLRNAEQEYNEWKQRTRGPAVELLQRELELLSLQI